jgi:hypothetical protein
MKSKGVLTSVLCILIALLVFSIFYYTNNTGRHLAVSEYNGVEEIDEIIVSIKSEIASREKAGTINDVQKKELNNRINLYEWVKANNITYDELIKDYAFSNATFGVRERFDFHFISVLVIQYIMLVLMIVLCAFLVSYDFSTGIHRQLYSISTSRESILGRKFVVYISSILACLLLNLFFTGMMSFAFKSEIKYVIIENAPVHAVSTSAYFGLEYLGLFDFILMFGVIFFAVSLIIRNIYISLVVNLGVVLGYLIPALLWSNTTIAVINATPLTHFVWGIPVWQIVVSRIIWWLLTCALSFVALRRFKRADL